MDPSEINKNVKVDVALVGDLREVLEQLLPRISGRDGAAWLKTIEASKGAVAVRDIKNLPDSGHLYAAHVMHDLWRLTGGDAIIVTDVGQHQMWEAQYFHHDKPRTLITSGGLGTMGYALPAAIGAKFACPEKEVWVVAGDGGFQMTAAELATIVQEKIKINIAVINNGYLGMVRQWQEFFYEQQLRSHAAGEPGFCEAGRRARHSGTRGAQARRGGSRGGGSARKFGRVPAQLHGGEGRLGVPHDSRGQRIARDDSPAGERSAGRVGGRLVRQ